MDSEEDQRTLFCGNLAEEVTEELLYELFLQAGPIQRVRIPKDREGRRTNFGFITFKHLVSVQYALQLMEGTSLFNKRLNIRPRNNKQVQEQNRRDFDNRMQAPNIMDLNVLMQMGQHMLLQPNRHVEEKYAPWERNRNFRDERRRDDNPYRNMNNSGYSGYQDRKSQNRNRNSHQGRRHNRR